MKRTRYIPIARVHEGQEFLHYGSLHRRATDEETRTHSARDLCESQKKPTVMAYCIDRGKKTPMSFVTMEDGGNEIKVVVAADGGKL